MFRYWEPCPEKSATTLPWWGNPFEANMIPFLFHDSESLFSSNSLSAWSNFSVSSDTEVLKKPIRALFSGIGFSRLWLISSRKCWLPDSLSTFSNASLHCFFSCSGFAALKRISSGVSRRRCWEAFKESCSSSTKWKLVPPKPNELTPALLGSSGEAQGRDSVLR